MGQDVFRADVLTAFSGIGFVLATIPLSWQMECKDFIAFHLPLF